MDVDVFVFMILQYTIYDYTPIFKELGDKTVF